MPTYDAVRRRLIVCCDGTWQSSVSGERNIPSNVTRLCRHLARSEVKKEGDKTILYNQMVFYDPGIGTGELTKEDASVQGGTGAGLSTNVIEAYNWLALNYQPGDKIYCFGFSRGAYTARSLSGFIAKLGICSPPDMMYFPMIYEYYERALPVKDDETPETTANRRIYEDYAECWKNGTSLEFALGDDAIDQKFVVVTGPRKPIDPASMQVEVVGVWDTVGSLGVPKIGGWSVLPKFLGGGLDQPGRQFHDVTLSNNVRHAFHALGLDERRTPFAPTLWYVPKGQTRDKDLSFKQVWFPGVHINVGGGSDDLLKERKGDFEQISNVTFSWMVQQLRTHLAFDEDSLVKAMQDQQALLEMLNKQHGVDSAKSGWSIGTIIDSFLHASYVIQLGGSSWREPGETLQPEDLVNPIPKRTTELGITNEEIHPCVFFRVAQLNRKSPALQRFVRKAKPNPKEGWEWVGKSADPKGPIIRIPEYRITSHDEEPGEPQNLERLIADYNGATPYLLQLDEMYNNGKDLTKADSYKTYGI